jgi:hypothetical protein
MMPRRTARKARAFLTAPALEKKIDENQLLAMMATRTRGNHCVSTVAH